MQDNGEGKEEIGGDMGELRQLTDSEKQVEDALDGKRRANNCLMDIKKVLERWNCAINPVILISGKGIAPNFEIIALNVIPGGNGG